MLFLTKQITAQDFKVSKMDTASPRLPIVNKTINCILNFIEILLNFFPYYPVGK